MRDDVALLLLFGLGLAAGLDATSDGSSPEWAPAKFTEDNMLVLDAATFGAAVEPGEKPVLVHFYAPWCGYCSALAPLFSKAADTLAAEGAPVRLAKVDGVANKSFAAAQGVEMYPTFRWYSNGASSAYTGGRKADEFVAWVRRKLEPSIELDESGKPPALHPSAWSAALKSGRVTSLALLQRGDAPQLAAYYSVARLEDGADFYHTFSKAVYREAAERAAAAAPKTAAAVASTAAPTAVLITPHDERFVPMAAGEGEDPEVFKLRLTEMLVGHMRPLVSDFTIETERMLFDGPALRTYVLAIGSPESLADQREAHTAAARSHRGRCVVIAVDATADAADGLKQYLGYGRGARPRLEYYGLVLEDDEEVRYKASLPGAELQGAALTAALSSFMAAVVDGTAERFYESEAVDGGVWRAPKLMPDKYKDEAGSGAVQVVTGSTFEEIVRGPKDVLLQVHAPWCAHCQAVAPAYEQLGQRLASVPSVTIAKMDGSKNEVEWLDVDGYPTFVLFTASNRKIELPETSKRTLEAFTDFVQANAEVPFELKHGWPHDEL